MTQQNADLAAWPARFGQTGDWGSKVNLQSMRPNGLPVRALLLSDELGISGFTKPGGERLCSTHTHKHTQESGKGDRSHNNKVQTGQTQRWNPHRARLSACWPHGRCSHTHAMIDLSTLILCTDSITSRAPMLLTYNTHTHFPSWQFKPHAAHSPEHSRPGELFQDRDPTPHPHTPTPHFQSQANSRALDWNSRALDWLQLAHQTRHSLTSLVMFQLSLLFDVFN